MEAAVQFMAHLCKALGYSQGHEFHYSKASPEARSLFFKELEGLDFSLFAVVVEKLLIPDNDSLRKHQSLKLFSLERLLGLCLETTKDARVYIDGVLDSDAKKVKTCLLREHRDKQGSLSISYERSRNSPLIQMADMVVGGLNRSFRTRGDTETFLRTVKCRRGGILVYP